MQELTQQEVAMIGGATFTGGSIFDTLGNLVELYGQTLFNVGEAVTSAVVGTGDTLLGLLTGNHS